MKSEEENEKSGEKDTQKGFELDELLKPLGGFGKFQKIYLAYVVLIILFAASSEFSYVFTAGELNHRCRVSACENNSSDEYSENWLPWAIPRTSTGSYSWCTRFNYTGETDPNSDGQTCWAGAFDSETVVSCSTDDFHYETDEWTIARESWGIDCESDKYMLTLIGSLNNAGEVLGSAVIGFLSDKFGRKTVVVNAAIVVALIGTIQSFSVNYAMFATLRLLASTVAAGLFAMPFVLALETVEPSKRVLVGFLANCGYSFGEISVAAVQWLTLDWRWMLRIARVPFLLLIIFHWTMPESVRWLIYKGRRDDAIAVLKKIADSNKTELTKEQEESVPYKDQLDETEPGTADVTAEFLLLLKSRKLRFRFIAMIFVWYVLKLIARTHKGF